MVLPVLSRPGKLFVACVVLGGAAAIGHSIALLPETPGRQWLLLAGLTILSGAFAVKVPSVPLRISVSEALVFASALLFGPAPATLTVALEGLIISIWARHRNIYRTLFSVAEPAITVYVSARLFFWLAGTGPLANQTPDILRLFVPLLAFTGSYFALNILPIAYVVSLETGGSVREFVRRHILYLTLNYLGSLAVALLLLRNATAIDVAALAVIVPLLVISYLTSRISMARVEDANRHLEQLNRLYLSTVETLAMAVDAKDHIMRGHIRRVQSEALALARVLGMRDETQFRALEAAALLHDLGKLAVPEHILNKPAALTPFEFAAIREHSSVGANILSTIDFPYPVAPLVRHHHENWDGSGYPDGLSGSAIPLGARILAVVDCFDALTSDRPYRKKMSHREALDVLLSRRGTMYDPMVVDAFVQMWESRDSQELEPAAAAAPEPTVRTRDWQVAPTLIPPAVERAAEAIARDAAAVVPDATSVVYAVDPSTGGLTAAYVSHNDLESLKGVTQRLGQRVTGWVGATRRSIVNCDPVLDLGELAARVDPPLCSCLSTPLIVNDTLVGVLTLFSPQPNRFEAPVAQQIESLSTRLAARLRPADSQADRDGAGSGDPQQPDSAEQQARSFDRVSQRRATDSTHRRQAGTRQADLSVPLKPRRMLKAQLTVPSEAESPAHEVRAHESAASEPRTAPADVDPIRLRNR